MRLETVDRPDAALCAQWRAQVQADGWKSPYFDPDFFRAVAGSTRTARLVVGETDGEPTAFLPLHVTSARIGQPIGGLLNDLHGVTGAGFAADMAAAAGTACLTWRHAVGRISAADAPAHGFHAVDLEGGFAAWEQDRAHFAKSAMRAIRTRTQKAEKAHGPARFAFHDRTPETFNALLAWKRAQYAETRQPDVLARPWVRAVIDQLAANPAESGARAQVSTLYFGDRLAAVHLGLRGRSVLHYWFPAYDPALAEFSPGNILLYRMIEASAQEGLSAVHLGAGEVRYKLEFANTAIPVRAATIFAHSAQGAMAAAAGRAIGGLGALLPERWRGEPERILRRVDRELSLRAA
jgi:CelD/BcsL family acetyltransferase involved in cellulose biosynthesis